jgi:hypothetical protein
MFDQLHLFGAAHVDPVGSMALMPNEACPGPCAACGTQPADETLERLLADPANRHLAGPRRPFGESEWA